MPHSAHADDNVLTSAQKFSPPTKDIPLHLKPGLQDVDPLENIVEGTAEKVMDVLTTYFWNSKDCSGFTRASEWCGRKMFRSHAIHWIRLGEPVRMVLPAFPFKSANIDKVSGQLPDFAEFIGLSRLNQMCLDVKKVYSQGAEITLATDGVVFNDLVLVDDKIVWEYGQAVRDMVTDNFFDNNIKVMHAMELLGVVEAKDLTERVFYETINTCRDKILAQFAQAEEEMEELIKIDPDSNLTYTGIKAFCKVDQANSIYRQEAPSKNAFHRDMASLALKILARSEGFGALIRARLPNHIRLSIHPSSGAAKLSICMVPQLPGDVARAPWMTSIAVDSVGNYRTVHSKDVRATHDLVERDGKPWLYRERTPLYAPFQDTATGYNLEHVYPPGIQVWFTAAKHSPGSPPSIVKEALQQLAISQPVHVCG